MLQNDAFCRDPLLCRLSRGVSRGYTLGCVFGVPQGCSTSSHPATPTCPACTALRGLEAHTLSMTSEACRDNPPAPPRPRALIPTVARAQLSQAEEVTIFSHFLHMHENGQRQETRQYRNDSSGNEVLVHSAEVEYYSFLQAGGFLVPTNDSVTIQVRVTMRAPKWPVGRRVVVKLAFCAG